MHPPIAKHLHVCCNHRGCPSFCRQVRFEGLVSPRFFLHILFMYFYFPRDFCPAAHNSIFHPNFLLCRPSSRLLRNSPSRNSGTLFTQIFPNSRWRSNFLQGTNQKDLIVEIFLPWRTSRYLSSVRPGASKVKVQDSSCIQVRVEKHEGRVATPISVPVSRFANDLFLVRLPSLLYSAARSTSRLAV